MRHLIRIVVLLLLGGIAGVVPLTQVADAATSSPSTLNYGNVAVNTTAIASVHLTIDAGYSFSGASGVSGLNPPFNFAGGTCNGGFTGPGTCTITETYTPTTTTTSTGEVDPFECPTGGGQCIAIPIALTGTGIRAASSSPSTLNYGNVAVNTPAALTSQLTIDAGYSFSGASGVSGLNPPFNFAGGTCNGGFTGPGTCTITETYTPTTTTTSTGEVDPFECPTGGGQCIAIPIALTGTGIRAASSSPSTLNYGNVAVNTPAALTSQLTIDAGYSFSGASGVSGLNPPFNFAGGTCNGGFTGPGTCTITETYTPTTTTTSTGEVDPFECPTGGGQCIAIPIALTGTGIRIAAATPATFGNVAVNTTATLHPQITVDPGYDLELSSGTGLNAPFSFDFGTCNGFTGPGTCTVTETYHPTGLTTSTATTTVDECPVGGGVCIPIPFDDSGTGAIVGVAAPASFGNVLVGSTAAVSQQITVDAGYQVQVASGTGVDPPFGYDPGGCNGFTGPGTCTVTETYTPTTAGSSSATTDIEECPVGGGACVPLAMADTGTGVTAGPTLTLPGNLTVDPTHPLTSVTYPVPVSASEPGGTIKSLTCTAPAPASTTRNSGRFPVGTTVVTCAARDANGTLATGQFSVHLRTPAELLDDLSGTVADSAGADPTLATLVTSAQAALSDADPTGACTLLAQFASRVGSDVRHGVLSSAIGSELRVDANVIRRVIPC